MGGAWWRAPALALGAALGLLGCGGGGDEPGTAAPAPPAFPRSDADTVVTVEMREFAFEGIPATVKGPKVFFEVSNVGGLDHELVVRDASGKGMGETPEFEKGDGIRTLALELQPGRYEAECLVKLGDKTHVDEGMEATFTVE